MMRDRALLASAALWAAGVPLWALWDRGGPVPAPTMIERGNDVVPGAMSVALQRPLFAAGETGDAEAPADAPRLLGIAGRIGRDAVALVRGDDGATRTMAPGERIEGWRLESVSADAALFTRGGRSARVALAEAEDQ